MKWFRKRKKMVLVITVVAFLLLLLLGYVLGPDRTWGPGPTKQQQSEP